MKPMQLKALAVSTSILHTACERARSSGRRKGSSEMCRHGVRRDVSSAMLKRREEQSERREQSERVDGVVGGRERGCRPLANPPHSA